MNKYLYSLGVGKFSFAMIQNPEHLIPSSQRPPNTHLQVNELGFKPLVTMETVCQGPPQWDSGKLS